MRCSFKLEIIIIIFIMAGLKTKKNWRLHLSNGNNIISVKWK